LANGTIRNIAAPMTPNNTPFQVASAVNFRDTYQNGTERVFYTNGSVAVFQNFYNGSVLLNKTFINFEIRPIFFYDGCLRPTPTADGSRVINCTTVNMTVFTFFPPPTYANTAYENATGVMREVLNTGTRVTQRFYLNGTAASFDSNNIFQQWLVAPVNGTLAPVPTGNVVNVATDGTKTVF